MIIPITKLSSSDTNNGEPVEWTMLELNGELLLPSVDKPPPESGDDTAHALGNRGSQRIELGLLRFQNVSSVWKQS